MDISAKNSYSNKLFFFCDLICNINTFKLHNICNTTHKAVFRIQFLGRGSYVHKTKQIMSITQQYNNNNVTYYNMVDLTIRFIQCTYIFI